MVEVTPFDGTIVGAPFRSVPSPVVNTAPILSNVLVDLDHHAQGRQALATVDIVDPDQDSVSLTYQWLKNEITKTEILEVTSKTKYNKNRKSEIDHAFDQNQNIIKTTYYNEDTISRSYNFV